MCHMSYVYNKMIIKQFKFEKSRRNSRCGCNLTLVTHLLRNMLLYFKQFSKNSFSIVIRDRRLKTITTANPPSPIGWFLVPCAVV